MNCSEFWKKYNETGMTPELAEHIASCDACAEKVVLDGFIDKAVANLDTFSAPDSIWERIENELDDVPVAPPIKAGIGERLTELFGHLVPQRPVPAFAGIALLLLITVGTTFMATRAFFPLSGEQRELRAVHELREAEERYLAAIDNLSGVVDESKSEIDPEIYDMYLEKLALLDMFIEECRDAVDINEGNINAHTYLAQAYQEKVETLRDMAQQRQ